MRIAENLSTSVPAAGAGILPARYNEVEEEQKERMEKALEPQKAFGWAARDPFGILSPFSFSRRFVFLSSLSPCLPVLSSLSPCLPLPLPPEGCRPLERRPDTGRSDGSASSYGSDHECVHDERRTVPNLLYVDHIQAVQANGEDDITIKILYCGICHTDLHAVKNDWGDAVYPLLPGHEIVGVVTEVGSKVSKFKVGDTAGIGCLVGSCGSCNECKEELENYCVERIFTYNSTYYDGTRTFGGYSNFVVVKDHFAVLIPEGMPLDGAAPLLCAGITVYSPMVYFGLSKPGLHLGVVGLGGLGHVAVRFGKAFGMKVTVISTSPSKEKEAIEHLGADAFVVSRDEKQMKAAMGTMDGIIDTVSALHPLVPLISLLKTNGRLVLVGVPAEPLALPAFPLIGGRKAVSGSMIGGLKETQEMIDFAAKHKITANIEVISMDYVNTAMERLAKNDVRYRFVIDVGNTLKEAP
ncbi:hypothetical protein ACLOJK_003155 [Asimina triloba]